MTPGWLAEGLASSKPRLSPLAGSVPGWITDQREDRLMTQPNPNLVVQPDPDRAEWLRSLEIPPGMVGWRALHDHELNTSENGLTQAQTATYVGETVDKLVAAQLDSIVTFLHLQKGLMEFGQLIDGFIYKKKEPAPTNGATTD